MIEGNDLRIRLCELHTESKKPYEIELGVVSDATQHRFVRVEAEKKKQLIANALQAIQDAAKAEGVGVVFKCRHLCMMMRGVEKQNSEMTTSAVLGSFRADEKVRQEFLSLIR